MKKNSNAVLIMSIVASIVLLLSLNYFAHSTGIQKAISWGLFQRYAMDGDIENLELYNQKTAYIHIKKDRLRLNKHKGAVVDKLGGPNYILEIVAVDQFKEKIKILNKELAAEHKISLIEAERSTGIIPFLQWLLPMCFIIGIPIFLIYRFAK